MRPKFMSLKGLNGLESDRMPTGSLPEAMGVRDLLAKLQQRKQRRKRIPVVGEQEESNEPAVIKAGAAKKANGTTLDWVAGNTHTYQTAPTEQQILAQLKTIVDAEAKKQRTVDRNSSVLPQLLGPAAAGAAIGGGSTQSLRGAGIGGMAGLGYTAGSSLGGILGHKLDMSKGNDTVSKILGGAAGAVGGGLLGSKLLKKKKKPEEVLAELGVKAGSTKTYDKQAFVSPLGGAVAGGFAGDAGGKRRGVAIGATTGVGGVLGAVIGGLIQNKLSGGHYQSRGYQQMPVGGMLAGSVAGNIGGGLLGRKLFKKKQPVEDKPKEKKEEKQSSITTLPTSWFRESPLCTTLLSSYIDNGLKGKELVQEITKSASYSSEVAQAWQHFFKTTV